MKTLKRTTIFSVLSLTTLLFACQSGASDSSPSLSNDSSGSLSSISITSSEDSYSTSSSSSASALASALDFSDIDDFVLTVNLLQSSQGSTVTAQTIYSVDDGLRVSAVSQYLMESGGNTTTYPYGNVYLEKTLNSSGEYDYYRYYEPYGSEEIVKMERKGDYATEDEKIFHLSSLLEISDVLLKYESYIAYDEESDTYSFDTGFPCDAENTITFSEDTTIRGSATNISFKLKDGFFSELDFTYSYGVATSFDVHISLDQRENVTVEMPTGSFYTAMDSSSWESAFAKGIQNNNCYVLEYNLYDVLPEGYSQKYEQATVKQEFVISYAKSDDAYQVTKKQSIYEVIEGTVAGTTEIQMSSETETVYYEEALDEENQDIIYLYQENESGTYVKTEVDSLPTFVLPSTLSTELTDQEDFVLTNYTPENEEEYLSLDSIFYTFDDNFNLTTTTQSNATHSLEETHYFFDKNKEMTSLSFAGKTKESASSTTFDKDYSLTWAIEGVTVFDLP